MRLTRSSSCARERVPLDARLALRFDQRRAAGDEQRRADDGQGEILQNCRNAIATHKNSFVKHGRPPQPGAGCIDLNALFGNPIAFFCIPFIMLSEKTMFLSNPFFEHEV